MDGGRQQADYVQRTPQSLGFGAISSYGLFSRLGRAAMVDFGLSGLLDRIEEYFGKKTVKVITFLLGLTMVCACLAFVGGFMQSAYLFFMANVDGSSALSLAWRIFTGIVMLAMLPLLASVIANAIEMRRDAMRMRSLLQMVDELLVEGQTTQLEANKALKEARNALSEAERVKRRSIG